MTKIPLFIHIPKTGGMSVRSVCQPPPWIDEQWRHGTQEEWMDALGDRYSEFSVFTVVREPISRFWSAWWYLRTQQPGHQFYISDAAERMVLAQYNKPLEFVTKLGHRFSDFLHFAPQSLWLCSDVDYVLRFESLDADFAAMCRKEGWHNIPLPHVNKTKRKGRMLRTEEMDNAIKEAYRDDYRRFGYDG